MGFIVWISTSEQHRLKQIYRLSWHLLVYGITISLMHKHMTFSPTNNTCTASLRISNKEIWKAMANRLPKTDNGLPIKPDRLSGENRAQMDSMPFTNYFTKGQSLFRVILSGL